MGGDKIIKMEKDSTIKIYLAAPIVNISELQRSEINQIKYCLEKFKTFDNYNISIYDPKDHGVPNAWGISMQEWCRCIFALDVVAIDNSDWIIVCDYGRKGTAGTAWECGYAFGKDKKVLIIQMNKEAIDYSVMMRGCSANYCTFEEFCQADYDTFINKILVERGRLPQTEILN